MEDTLGVRRNERATLEGALDWYRAVVERKVDGLSLEEAGREMTPTGLSLLGSSNTSDTWNEDGSARYSPVKMSSLSTPRRTSRPSSSSTPATRSSRLPRSTAERWSGRRDRRRLLTGEPEHGDAMVRGPRQPSLDTRAHAGGDGQHAGHMDVMREKVDGRTGD